MNITQPLAQPQFVKDMSIQPSLGIKPATASAIKILNSFIEGEGSAKAALAPTAPQLLNKAATIMQARAATYDKPEGERSMGATVAAFNTITGQALTEAHGWLLMTILKMVRDNQRPAAHLDSVEDLVAYASLYGEARLK